MFWGREPLQGTRPSPWSREEGKGRFECGHRPGWGRGRRDGGRQSSAPTSVLEKIILKNYLPPFTVLKFSQSCKGRNFGTTVCVLNTPLLAASLRTAFLNFPLCSSREIPPLGQIPDGSG